MPRADISSDPSTTSQARLVRETTPEHRRHGRHGNLSASVLRLPNLVACDLSGGFEFVSAMGLWDLYLPIAASLGPRPRRGRRRWALKRRKGVTIGLKPETSTGRHWALELFSRLCIVHGKMPSLHPSMRSAASSLFELVNQGSPAMQRSLPWTGVRSCVSSTLQFPGGNRRSIDVQPSNQSQAPSKPLRLLLLFFSHWCLSVLKHKMYHWYPLVMLEHMYPIQYATDAETA